jgi:hypothetical protein
MTRTAHCKELAEHPNAATVGTGADPASRRWALKESFAEATYRKGLFAAAERSVGVDPAISLGLADDR